MYKWSFPSRFSLAQYFLLCTENPPQTWLLTCVLHLATVCPVTLSFIWMSSSYLLESVRTICSLLLNMASLSCKNTLNVYLITFALQTVYMSTRWGFGFVPPCVSACSPQHCNAFICVICLYFPLDFYWFFQRLLELYVRRTECDWTIKKDFEAIQMFKKLLKAVSIKSWRNISHPIVLLYSHKFSIRVCVHIWIYIYTLTHTDFKSVCYVKPMKTRHTGARLMIWQSKIL